MIQKFHFGYIPQRIQSSVLRSYWCTHVYGSMIHNSQEMEATQVSMDQWMDKENVVFTYNWILSSHEKLGNMTRATTWRKLEDIKWNKPVTKW